MLIQRPYTREIATIVIIIIIVIRSVGIVSHFNYKLVHLIINNWTSGVIFFLHFYHMLTFILPYFFGDGCEGFFSDLNNFICFLAHVFFCNSSF
ncbi:hypothetical protein JYU34_004584 [Plutella xylostella]|uniref:Uncharacterized protein n=1 Tax=Plutella xylostella TaxID=51655 RepID=A0ABQ7QYC4_PLUXY|nr:hypothetical protein JYU34_004584 [Plutella xylostella]